jgi:hypothetical protein
VFKALFAGHFEVHYVSGNGTFTACCRTPVYRTINLIPVTVVLLITRTPVWRFESSPQHWCSCPFLTKALSPVIKEVLKGYMTEVHEVIVKYWRENQG